MYSCFLVLPSVQNLDFPYQCRLPSHPNCAPGTAPTLIYTTQARVTRLRSV